MADVFWLSEDQFSRLSPLLQTDSRGVPRVDDRRVISGIVHVAVAGRMRPTSTQVEQGSKSRLHPARAKPHTERDHRIGGPSCNRISWGPANSRH